MAAKTNIMAPKDSKSMNSFGNIKKRPNRWRKKPFVLNFDEKAREEFLTGFRKRKLQRKKKAQEELEKELKEERKRIRNEAKNAYKNLVVSHRDIPELAEFNDEPDVVDMDTHQVFITELDPMKLASDNNWIGANQVNYNETHPEENTVESSELEDPDEVEGMELKPKKKSSASKAPKSDFKSLKDVRKYVKQIATKNVKASKVYQKKEDVEKIRNKKKKRREEIRKEKAMKSQGSKKKKKVKGKRR